MKDRIYTVYVIKEDSIPVYVGLTSTSLQKRFVSHCNDMRESHVMGPIIKAKGKEHFTIEPLIQYFDKNAAYNAEAELTEIYREKYNLYNRNTGAKQSEKTIQKKSKPVLCVELNKVFQSTIAAARYLNIKHGNISHCCLGKRHTAGGYHFKFA